MLKEGHDSTERIRLGNEFFVSNVDSNFSLSFFSFFRSFLAPCYIRTLSPPFISPLNLHTLPKPSISKGTSPRPNLYHFFRTEYRQIKETHPPFAYLAAMKCSIIALALVQLASFASASAISGRQEFEVSITFIGEGSNPSTYGQQFPTDDQPYPIGKPPRLDFPFHPIIHIPMNFSFGNTEDAICLS